MELIIILVGVIFAIVAAILFVTSSAIKNRACRKWVLGIAAVFFLYAVFLIISMSAIIIAAFLSNNL